MVSKNKKLKANTSAQSKTASGSKVVKVVSKRHRGVTVLLDTDDVLRDQVGGFSNFLKEYAVVGLALGFIVGQQANGVVKQFVASFVDPMARFWFGRDLSTQSATIHRHHQAIQLPWGAFVYVLLEFFIVLIIIYAVIKLFRLDRFAKPPQAVAIQTEKQTKK